MVKEDVFLHRRSSVANSAPEFLVYSELLHTKRPYMHGATRVKADWLVEYALDRCAFFQSPSKAPNIITTVIKTKYYIGSIHYSGLINGNSHCIVCQLVEMMSIAWQYLHVLCLKVGCCRV